jgi:hypothetical protein
VVDERLKAARVVVLLVMIVFVRDDEAAVRLVVDAFTKLALVAERSPVNVLSPANVWVVVETNPRAVSDASGMLKV